MKKNPIRLNDSFKHYTYDQDKTCNPVDTIARLKQRLAEVNLDILKEVRRIDNGRLDIPVYFSMTGKDAYEVIGNKKQMGKGATPEQSQASACMELAERFSFFAFKKNPDNFIRATWPELKAQGYPLLPLEKLLQSVHDSSTDLATLEKLLADLPMQWTWATCLNRNEEVLIPFSWFFAINEFNGPSAGNTYEEAIIQGICEIVERHVCAVVDYEKIPAPRIDLASIKDPVSRELIAKFTRNGIEVHINDFTLDTGIPTVSALAIDRATFPELSEIVWTAGTTPNPEKALIRALTEVAQLAGDFNSAANYVASGLPKPLAMEEVAYLTEAPQSLALHAMPDLADDNLRLEIENCLAALKKLDMEVYLVNTIHPDLQVPAIYTVVPGAHFRERSRIGNVGLFAAKLAFELVTDPEESTRLLLDMEGLLPDAYYIEFYLGRNLHRLGRLEEGLARLESALDRNPQQEDIPYIYSFMGECLKDMERFAEAIAVLSRGTELDDERPDLHNLLGFCHFKLGDYEKAVRHFSRSVQLNPASAIDYANLGVNYRKLGRTEEAVSNLEIALSLDPGIDFARVHLEELRG
ncbi:MAG: YcaO-like family protein [Thermodesulfobacteriota bacterium]